MAKFIITADSSCDGNLNELKSKGVEVIFFKYSNGERIYQDDMNEENYKTFFKNMSEGTVYKTSQINPQEFVDFFKPLLEYNLPIIHVSLSSGLSNTINNVYVAASLLSEEKTCDIRPIDSLIASSGILLIINKLIEYRDANMDADEAQNKIKEFVKHVKTYYTTNTLTYFARGGRLSKVEALVGNVLKINPILDCTSDGRLRVVFKPRGSRHALDEIVSHAKKQAIDPSKQTVIITHADNEERGRELGERLVHEANFKDYKLYMMGTIIGSHTGPGLIALFFYGNDREGK
ncbi:MAG: DegV family protein [Erysipelotrichaceae bacterium]|nr:DegV family protein [Erysipelotrichaceae bacterium]